MVVLLMVSGILFHCGRNNEIRKEYILEPVIESVIMLGFLIADASSK